MGFAKIFGVLAGTWTLVAASGATCPYVPPYTAVGRDEGPGGSTADWCPSQITTCGLICGGSTSVNTCNPSSICYECQCSDGTTPDLSIYYNTIPSLICSRIYMNCETSPGAAFSNACSAYAHCGSIDLSDPFSVTTKSTATPSSTSSVPLLSSLSLLSATTIYLPSITGESTSSSTLSTNAVTSTSSLLSSSTLGSVSFSSTTNPLSNIPTTASSTSTALATTSTVSTSSLAPAATFTGAARMAAVPWTGIAMGVVGLAISRL